MGATPDERVSYCSALLHNPAHSSTNPAWRPACMQCAADLRCPPPMHDVAHLNTLIPRSTCYHSSCMPLVAHSPLGPPAGLPPLGICSSGRERPPGGIQTAATSKHSIAFHVIYRLFRYVRQLWGHGESAASAWMGRGIVQCDIGAGGGLGTILSVGSAQISSRWIRRNHLSRGKSPMGDWRGHT